MGSISLLCRPQSPKPLQRKQVYHLVNIQQHNSGNIRSYNKVQKFLLYAGVNVIIN